MLKAHAKRTSVTTLHDVVPQLGPRWGPGCTVVPWVLMISPRWCPGQTGLLCFLSWSSTGDISVQRATPNIWKPIHAQEGQPSPGTVCFNFLWLWATRLQDAGSELLRARNKIYKWVQEPGCLFGPLLLRCVISCRTDTQLPPRRR